MNPDITCSVGTIENAFKEEKKKEAIAFLEWVSKNFITFNSEVWYLRYGNHNVQGEPLSADQIYQRFKMISNLNPERSVATEAK